MKFIKQLSEDEFVVKMGPEDGDNVRSITLAHDYLQFNGRNGKMVNITKEEYENLLKNRVDKINEKVASDLLWTLISNSASGKEIDRREKKWKTFLPNLRNDINEQLSKLCMFFCSPENYKYNTFHIRQSLCRGEFDEFKDNSALVIIGEYLQHVLKLLA